MVFAVKSWIFTGIIMNSRVLCAPSARFRSCTLHSKQSSITVHRPHLAQDLDHLFDDMYNNGTAPALLIGFSPLVTFSVDKSPSRTLYLVGTIWN